MFWTVNLSEYKLSEYKTRLNQITNPENSKQYCIEVLFFTFPNDWISNHPATVQKLLWSHNISPSSCHWAQVKPTVPNSTEQASWLNQLAMIFQAKYWYGEENNWA